MWGDLTDPATKDALRLSLECSLAATALSAVFGIPLAWVLARTDFPGRRLTRALVLLPMVLPPVVGGIALFFAIGPRGLLGQYLDRWFGVRLPFTTLGTIVAETFVAMPFLIITVEAALRGIDRRYEDAASTLGAGRWTVFRRVTLPLISAVAARRCRAQLGPGPRRVRCHHHLRRQPARQDPDHAARHLHCVRARPGDRGRVEPGARGDLDRGAGRAPRPLVLRVSLDADLDLQRGALDLSVIIRAEPGETVVLLGPNGAGKTTLLGTLAGLLAIDRGHITLDDDGLDDPARNISGAAGATADRSRVPRPRALPPPQRP